MTTAERVSDGRLAELTALYEAHGLELAPALRELRNLRAERDALQAKLDRADNLVERISRKRTDAEDDRDAALAAQEQKL